jgi:hypothetical protein
MDLQVTQNPPGAKHFIVLVLDIVLARFSSFESLND